MIKSMGVNGLGIYSDSSVDLFYYDIVLVTEPWMLYWLLNHKHVCCAQMCQAGCIYLGGG